MASIVDGTTTRNTVKSMGRKQNEISNKVNEMNYINRE